MRWINGSWPIIAPTPIGPTWGWRLRLLEIAFLPFAAVFYAFAGLCGVLTWMGERLFR